MVPPIVLYCPPAVSDDGLRATVIVTASAVIGAVLFRRSCSSANHGLLLATTPDAVTVPVVGFATVSATVVECGGVLALLAVMVTVALPSVAVDVAASVSVLVLLVVCAGANVAETPLGNPVAANVTLPVKPPVRVSVIATVPPAPRLTVNEVG